MIKHILVPVLKISGFAAFVISGRQGVFGFLTVDLSNEEI